MAKDKIVDISKIKSILDGRRSKGGKVVFTNGCFDLLHIGHIRYLQDARKEGEILVVGLNSDRSVKEIKGERRPVVCEADRAELLAALDAIDYVVIFDEPTPYALIELIRPDVLVKGGDWKKDAIVGAELVESYGGRIRSAPFTEGYSTASLIASIVRRFS